MPQAISNFVSLAELKIPLPCQTENRDKKNKIIFEYLKLLFLHIMSNEDHSIM